MATFLLTWKPKLYDQWLVDIPELIMEINENGFCKYGWSTGSSKKIQPNDRVFMMKLGENPGIVASGWTASDVYEDKHWNPKAKSKKANYVEVDFDTIINPETEAIFPLPLQKNGVYRNQKTWTPQSSGMELHDEVAEKLEKDWANFLRRPVPVREISYADEVDFQKTFREGAPKKVTTTVYERKPAARAICIKFYGAVCKVCEFDFSKKYGELGKGFIHVHHLQPKAEIGKSVKLNPIRDLRPVCPNCHAMIHQRKPVYSIEELKMIMKNAGK